ncbi:hypothetical protein PCL1606_13390 [Pseudomonas chlororaphis]|uniref:Uncharacterized protein n=1 Tax=Pseudomonas chlororaphis TaxID=587753 RepID=A0A0D5XVT1_9PSED|nr:hypothetical protein PCL1606_13390 [Pseudomonas chlororaphis]
MCSRSRVEGRVSGRQGGDATVEQVAHFAGSWSGGTAGNGRTPWGCGSKV